MSWDLQRISLDGGLYRGVLSGGTGEPPALEATFEAEPLDGLEIAPLEEGGGFAVSLPLPARLITDEVRTVTIHEAGSAHVLDSIAVVAGVSGPDDIRIEMDLMRAEIDLLKKAMRRQFRG